MAFSALNRALAPLKTALQLLASRVVVQAIREAPKLRTAQLTGLRGETLEGVEVFGHYGFASSPKAGAEGIGVCVGAVRDHMVLIATADRTVKITLSPGEVALHDDLGQKVHLKRDGIEIATPGNVTVTAGGDATVSADGDATLEAGGDATIDAGVNANITAGGNVLVQATGVINLGGLGGQGVARIGDQDSNGDALIQGSTKVFAV